MGKNLVPPGLTYLADNIITRQNILGATKEQGARWARDLNLPRLSETMFFAGCGYQYSAQLERLMSLIRGIDKSVIGAEYEMTRAAPVAPVDRVTAAKIECAGDDLALIFGDHQNDAVAKPFAQ